MVNKSLNLALGAILVAIIVGTVWYQAQKETLYAPSDNMTGGRSGEINSFVTCKGAGYPIMESYPERCRTSEGLTFVNYEACVQVIAYGRNPETGETRMFPTPCDVPQGWIVTENVD